MFSRLILCYMRACSRIGHTTWKTRKATRWSGASRLKKCWSITTATTSRQLRGWPTNHDWACCQSNLAMYTLSLMTDDNCCRLPCISGAQPISW